MREDKQLLILTHLSQLLDFVTGIGGFIVPLIIWLSKRDEIIGMDMHGKAILNFRISMFIYILICIPLILFFGIGLLGIIVLAFFYLIFPIRNAIRASYNLPPSYPFSYSFIQ
ncbi:MAG: tRNA modification GTPase [Flavobacteriaceae bacterium]|nr:tRNA modification GTPase [Flavobacteriaceae bacterium]|tara:strand:- start:104161 stop:104499 length:339 start_codon:yes stop_codon:yes gene_type:complete